MIYIDKKNLVFHLQTDETSYIIAVNKETKQLQTIYYGSKIAKRDNQNDIAKNFERPFSTYIEDHKNYSLDSMQLEFSTLGFSDYRHPTIDIEQNDSNATHFKFKDYKIENYNEEIGGDLPFAHCKGKTLVVILEDKIKDIHIEMRYTPITKSNIILKNVKLINNSPNDLIINKLLSSSLDFLNSDFKVMTLDGSWIRERQINIHDIKNNHFRISSREGVSSSTHHPFLGLLEPETTEFHGKAYGFTLMYSSNFEINFEINQYKNARVSLGINSDTFKWTLKSNESFSTPQAVLNFSDKGMNGLSQNFHNFVRANISPPQWTKKVRPILLNNWEATYFNFDEKKILSLATEAKKVGIELFCLDDGWFIDRNEANSSLGDWYVDKKKLPNGLDGLSKKINDLGLKFGLWFEPEMISKKSKLYKEHPDWAVQTTSGYPMVQGREQYILDLTNEDAFKYIYERMDSILSSSNIEYVKWDMNRPFATVPYKGYEHKYILSLYKLLKKLTDKYPNILWEGCSAGGNRFDLGVLKYFPQIWTSDNTDAHERMKIQWGTSIIYPLSVMSNHVSASPNHQVKRITDLKTRMDVSNFGVMGYEIDLLKATDEDKKKIKEHISLYKTMRKAILHGEFYRLKSPFVGNVAGWQVVSPNKKLSVGLMYKGLATPNPYLETIRLHGLEPKFKYWIPTTEFKFSGDELLTTGIFLPETMAFGDFKSEFFVLSEAGEIKLLNNIKALIRTK